MLDCSVSLQILLLCHCIGAAFGVAGISLAFLLGRHVLAEIFGMRIRLVAGVASVCLVTANMSSELSFGGELP